LVVTAEELLPQRSEAQLPEHDANKIKGTALRDLNRLKVLRCVRINMVEKNSMRCALELSSVVLILIIN
jgi:hypothetical protein